MFGDQPWLNDTEKITNVRIKLCFEAAEKAGMWGRIKPARKGGKDKDKTAERRKQHTREASPINNSYARKTEQKK